MVEKENIKNRSPMNISIESRLVGLAITIFILILTIKSELLQKTIIITQLVLSIPFLLVSMISNAKIVDKGSLEDYYIYNRITNSIGIALVFNTLGLLIVNYLSISIGIVFFGLLLFLLSCLLYLNFNKRKIYNELFMIIIIFILGLLPSIIMVY